MGEPIILCFAYRMFCFNSSAAMAEYLEELKELKTILSLKVTKFVIEKFMFYFQICTPDKYRFL